MKKKLLKEDRLYFEMLRALVQCDLEKSRTTPDLKKVELYHWRAKACRAELELFATKLSNMPRAKFDRLLRQVSAPPNVGKMARDIVARNARTGEAHPRMRTRNVQGILEKGLDTHFRSLKAQIASLGRLSARAKRVAALLEDKSIERYKTELKKLEAERS